MAATSQVLLLLATALVAGNVRAAESGIHKIPDAPLQALAMTNPHDPVTVDPAILDKGARIFRTKCQKCHGELGDGKGPKAETIEIKPAAFSKPGYLSGRKDGQLYWIIANGSPGTEMPAHGPGTDINFTPDEIWQVITYLRRQFTK
ncbi:MAG: cytochrome c [Magnetococcales bacterium]|nr:cytochrome c [Magnetococcales bacterium]